MDYRDYLTPEQLEAIYRQQQQADPNASLTSVGELALSLLSGAAAEPLSGIAGLLSMGAGGNAQQNADWVRKVQEGLTYQPRNPYALNKLGETLAPVAEAIEGGSRYLGDKTLEYTGSPALAAAAYTLPMGLAEVIDSTPLLYSATKLPKRGLLGADIDIADIGGQNRLGSKQRGVWGAGGAEGAPHDQMLYAQQLLDEGYTKAQVWDETAKTGTPIYVDAQGNLTYPIPATNLKIKPPQSEAPYFNVHDRGDEIARARGITNLRELSAADQNSIWGQAFEEQRQHYKDYAPTSIYDLTPRDTSKVGSYFDYPELYEAYPQARDIELQGYDPRGEYGGWHRAGVGDRPPRIAVRTGYYDANNEFVKYTPEQITSIMEHELTHAVQDWEDLPRGLNKDTGEAIARQSYDAQENAYGLIEKLDQQATDIMRDTDVNTKSSLLYTSRRLDTIKQLEGYLKDYYNGGKLTDKRRHILNAGWLMDHNKEFRMRMDLPWAKKHRPQAERDAVYAQYIENVLADARANLDPDLVAQVEASGVKNPTKKFERQVDSVNKQIKPIQDRQNEIRKLANTGADSSRIPQDHVYQKDGKWYAAGVYGDDYLAKQFSSRESAEKAYLREVVGTRNYMNAEGEFNARLMQEYLKKAQRMGDDAYKINPRDMDEWMSYPESNRLITDPQHRLDPNSHQWVRFNDPVFQDNLLDIGAPSPIKRKPR